MNEKNLYKSLVETRINALEEEIRKIEEEMEDEIKRVKQKYYKKAKEKALLEERLFKDLYTALLHDISKMYNAPARIQLYHPVRVVYNHSVPMISEGIEKYLERWFDHTELADGEAWAIPFLVIHEDDEKEIEIDYFYRIPSLTNQETCELEEKLKPYNVHPFDLLYIGTHGKKKIEEFVNEITLDGFLSKLSPEERRFYEPNILELIEFAEEVLNSEKPEKYTTPIDLELFYISPDGDDSFIRNLIKISKKGRSLETYVDIVRYIKGNCEWYTKDHLKYINDCPDFF